MANDRGEFRIEGLLPGSYRVTVTAKGFADATADVDVEVSVVRDIAVTLKPESGRETLNVQGTASSITTQSIDTASAVHQGVVGARDLETLPLPARSFANIAYLVPGTEPVEPSDPTKARITAVSTGGSSGLNNELSVDGADNSDDWIGGFLQNFSPDAIQEFAVRTSNEDADTGWTTAGSVVITTKHGTNDWHGDGAFYERAAQLNARFPIENPAESCTDGVCEHNPKQPFSRQNYVATLGGPLAKNKVWFFTSFEHVHENASIAYSPASTTQFNALAQLASEGLITGIPSIAVPATVPIPFRDYIGSVRFDWAESSKSQWFLRTSEDSYLTHNALVQQATLPSTGLITHNNYWNTALSNTYTFSPTWLGTLVLDASLLHLTQTRNSRSRFCPAISFQRNGADRLRFRNVRRQPVRHAHHSFPRPAQSGKISVPLRPEPRCGQSRAQVRSRLHSRTGARRRVCSDGGAVHHLSRPTPIITSRILHSFITFLQARSAIPRRLLRSLPPPPASPALYTPAGDGSFSQNVQRLALYAEDSWRVSHHLTVNYGLRYQTTFGLFHGFRTKPGRQSYRSLCWHRWGTRKRFLMMTASKSRLAWGSPTRPATARKP